MVVLLYSHHTGDDVNTISSPSIVLWYTTANYVFALVLTAHCDAHSSHVDSRVAEILTSCRAYILFCSRTTISGQQPRIISPAR